MQAKVEQLGARAAAADEALEAAQQVAAEQQQRADQLQVTPPL